jgi:hypothetical protein
MQCSVDEVSTVGSKQNFVYPSEIFKPHTTHTHTHTRPRTHTHDISSIINLKNLQFVGKMLIYVQFHSVVIFSMSTKKKSF